MGGDFKLIKSGAVPYLIIPAFAATGLVDHGFSTRLGGISTGVYATMNLGLGKNDRSGNVLENRRRFLRALGLELDSLVTGQQVHGTRVALVTEKERGRGSRSRAQGLPDTDAMITNTPGVTLGTFFADCVPLFFLDPVRKVIGLAHAGWKGTVAGIVRKTIACMHLKYGTEAAQCLVGIGPSIGPCCYEVGRQVVAPLATAFPNWHEFVVPAGKGKWYLDLWQTNQWQFLKAGVKKENIFISRLCTACHEKIFFSFRAHQGYTGSLAAVLALK